MLGSARATSGADSDELAAGLGAAEIWTDITGRHRGRSADCCVLDPRRGPSRARLRPAVVLVLVKPDFRPSVVTLMLRLAVLDRDLLPFFASYSKTSVDAPVHLSYKTNPAFFLPSSPCTVTGRSCGSQCVLDPACIAVLEVRRRQPVAPGRGLHRRRGENADDKRRQSGGADDAPDAGGLGLRAGASYPPRRQGWFLLAWSLLLNESFICTRKAKLTRRAFVSVEAPKAGLRTRAKEACMQPLWEVR